MSPLSGSHGLKTAPSGEVPVQNKASRVESSVGWPLAWVLFPCAWHDHEPPESSMSSLWTMLGHTSFRPGAISGDQKRSATRAFAGVAYVRGSLGAVHSPPQPIASRSGCPRGSDVQRDAGIGRWEPVVAPCSVIEQYMRSLSSSTPACTRKPLSVRCPPPASDHPATPATHAPLRREEVVLILHRH